MEWKGKEMIFVFTGPHGAGRKTVAEMAGDTLGMKKVLSYTTRPPKKTEVDGQDYHFISREKFLEDQQLGKFVEVREINGHLYGMQGADVEHMLQSAGSIYLIMDRYGADTLKNIYGDKLVRIFIYADRKHVMERLAKSGDSEEMIKRYMAHYEEEMDYKSQCEYSFENIDLAHTVFDLTKALDRYLERNLLELD